MDLVSAQVRSTDQHEAVDYIWHRTSFSIEWWLNAAAPCCFCIINEHFNKSATFPIRMVNREHVHFNGINRVLIHLYTHIGGDKWRCLPGCHSRCVSSIFASKSSFDFLKCFINLDGSNNAVKFASKLVPNYTFKTNQTALLSNSKAAPAIQSYPSSGRERRLSEVLSDSRKRDESRLTMSFCKNKNKRPSDQAGGLTHCLARWTNASFDVHMFPKVSQTSPTSSVYNAFPMNLPTTSSKHNQLKRKSPWICNIHWMPFPMTWPHSITLPVYKHLHTTEDCRCQKKQKQAFALCPGLPALCCESPGVFPWKATCVPALD